MYIFHTSIELRCAAEDLRKNCTWKTNPIMTFLDYSRCFECLLNGFYRKIVFFCMNIVIYTYNHVG